MLKALTVKCSEYVNKERIIANMINLKPIAKVRVKFLKSILMPTTHTTTVSQERIILLYVIVKDFGIDVGKIIEYFMKKQKVVALLFQSLITSICEFSKIKIYVSDERVKNE